MNIHVLTLFPEMIEAQLLTSVTGRAHEKGLWSLNLVQIRDFSQGRYNKVDDRLYGGGKGMLMQADVLDRAIQSVAARGVDLKSIPRLFLSPRGKRFTQKTAQALAQYEDLLFLCGHYEGVDQRFLDAYQFMEVSLGDFVLTGGEIACSAMIDATLRMLPGVLPDASAYEAESHFAGRLESAQYTQPPVWAGREVPSLLRSGHHRLIEQAKSAESLWETLKKRPDLLENEPVKDEEWKNLEAYLLQ